MIAVSNIFGCGMNVCVKLLNGLENPVPAIEVRDFFFQLATLQFCSLLNVLQLVGLRMFFTYFICIAYMHYTNVSNPVLGPPDVRLFLVLRGFTGFCGLFMMWKSLQYLGVADAVTLTFLLPTFTAIIAFVSLGETLSAGELIGGAVSLCGVVLIAQPSFLFGRYGHVAANSTPAERLWAVGISMIGIIGGSISVTAMRFIGHRAHVLHSLAYFAFCSTIASVSGMILLKIPFVMPTSWTWLLLFMTIFIFGFAAQMLLAAGLQREKAARGMLGMYIQVVFAMIFDRVVFQEKPSLLSYSGTALIIGSAVYIALSKTADATHPVNTTEEDVEVQSVPLDLGSSNKHAMKEIV
ncbi:drug/metabolite transporter superfamily [Sistotremastrum suecicum HHB10207 ss-3]|uniref:Drug/metabolite transporter superfamily n=1 Tax=Sistotremastrum suecicum HHB10207 ss-3 TaxID=1314776 RepID=A0A166B0P1_9AGAM|nr:drug/metabolite transporter superfamily [Sistotremastrum suecicum HHB10207 ss-3]